MAELSHLRSMLNSIINDKPEQAQVELHSYLSAKMQEVAGLRTDAPVEEPEVSEIDKNDTPEPSEVE